MDPLPLSVRDPVAHRLAEVRRMSWTLVTRAVAVLERAGEVVPHAQLMRKLARWERQQRRRPSGHRAQRSRTDKEMLMSGRVVNEEDLPESERTPSAPAATNGHLRLGARDLTGLDPDAANWTRAWARFFEAPIFAQVRQHESKRLAAHLLDRPAAAAQFLVAEVFEALGVAESIAETMTDSVFTAKGIDAQRARLAGLLLEVGLAIVKQRVEAGR